MVKFAPFIIKVIVEEFEYYFEITSLKYKKPTNILNRKCTTISGYKKPVDAVFREQLEWF
jgi:hypothetical protein